MNSRRCVTLSPTTGCSCQVSFSASTFISLTGIAQWGSEGGLRTLTMGRLMRPGKKKSYWQTTDAERIQAQWHKLTGLQSREEWSAAIVRTATAAEIAANFAVRQEFESKSSFDSDFVDSLLLWGNGLEGKMNRLLLPLTNGRKRQKTLASVKKDAEVVNNKRNSIVHR